MSYEPPTFVTLREMVERMAHYRDDEPFRWYQGAARAAATPSCARRTGHLGCRS